MGEPTLHDLAAAKPAHDDRLTAKQIHAAAVENGLEELERPATQLLVSGLAGGLTLGLSAIGVAAVRARLGEGEGARLLSLMLYPVGFIGVIVGRAQLFTENTLYPVLNALDDRHQVPSMLRLWFLVLVSNLAGALLFAVLAMHSGALDARMVDQLGKLGQEALARQGWPLFWSAVVGGWLIALVAWTVTASQHTIGHVLMVALFTFLIGLGHFTHCIAGSAETLAAAVYGAAGWGDYLRWLGLAVAGNVAGGVLIVTLINYGQVKATA